MTQLRLALFIVVIFGVTANNYNNNHNNKKGYSYSRTSYKPFDTSNEDELWQDDDDDDKRNPDRMNFKGMGREFDLFGVSPRGGSTTSSSSNDGGSTRYYASSSTNNNNGIKRRSKSNRPSSSYSSASSSSWLRGVREWIAAGNLPKIQCRVEPNTTLKVRKTFRPLKTVIRLGADFNTQLGVWQFKSSWEDSLIGGKLTLAGRELQLSKTWLLSVGAVEDLVTRLRFRAAVDLGTMKAYARLGFRTERLSPINVVEGFTLMKQLPLDGTQGHVKLEVKANFAFPEPEIEYSTENHRSFVGMGDIEVNIDELNLLLDY